MCIYNIVEYACGCEAVDGSQFCALKAAEKSLLHLTPCSPTRRVVRISRTACLDCCRKNSAENVRKQHPHVGRMFSWFTCGFKLNKPLPPVPSDDDENEAEEEDSWYNSMAGRREIEVIHAVIRPPPEDEPAIGITPTVRVNSATPPYELQAVVSSQEMDSPEMAYAVSRPSAARGTPAMTKSTSDVDSIPARHLAVPRTLSRASIHRKRLAVSAVHREVANPKEAEIATDGLRSHPVKPNRPPIAHRMSVAPQQPRELFLPGNLEAHQSMQRPLLQRDRSVRSPNGCETLEERRQLAIMKVGRTPRSFADKQGVPVVVARRNSVECSQNDISRQRRSKAAIGHSMAIPRRISSLSLEDRHSPNSPPR